MKVLIVHAHPEPNSFNGALTRHANKVLQQEGNEVKIIDLYTSQFDPVSSRKNFTTIANPDYFRQRQEELYANDHDGFANDIIESIESLEWCDTLILQFPLWWFGLPAILKGWVDRVFVNGRIFGSGKFFEKGTFYGKKALLSLTTGSPADRYGGTDCIFGDIDAILYPINHGILALTGFTVLPQFVAWSVGHTTDERRAQYLQEWEQRLLTIEITPPIEYPPLSAYDTKGRRRKSWNSSADINQLL